MNKKIHKKILVSGVIATLSFLPGCTDTFKGGSTSTQTTVENKGAETVPMTGEVLMSINGVPAITTDSLAKQKENLLRANPGMKQAIAELDPLVIDRTIFEGLFLDRIIDEYLTSRNITTSSEYQADLEAVCDAQRKALNVQYFSKQIPVTVSESEIRDFYETNKDTMLKISQGGVAASGIEFADGAAARAFVAQVKASPGGFKKVAQDDGLNAKIKDFKLVNNQSVGIDGQLRDKIAAIKTVPSVEMFEVNGMFWVINATEKEEPKYVPYEQIKDGIKEQLEKQKRGEAGMKEIENLKKQYNVEINEQYFMPAQQEVPASAQAMANPNVNNQVHDKEQRLA